MKKSGKRWIVTISVIIVVLFSIVLGGSAYLLNYSLQPYATVQHKNAVCYEYMFEEYPFLQSWVDSLTTTEALRDTFIINPEGIWLHGYYVKAAQPTNKTATIVHGYTDNAIRMFMIGYLYSYHLGYNILLPDLHYQGESGGSAIQMGWKDRLDVMQWMHVANDLFRDSVDTQMVVHGISMGGATTMMVSGEEQPEFTKCFVEDCGYTSVWDEFQYQLKQDFHLPAFPLLYVADWLCNKKYGWGFKEASSLNQVKKCQLPMLFIHGGDDHYVPTEMVYSLYEAKSEPKELWIAPGAAHAMSYKDHEEEYTERVKNFVGQYIN